jgi:tartrate-resistant acid phosphatase type 5
MMMQLTTFKYQAKKTFPTLISLLTVTLSSHVLAMSNTPKTDVEGIEAAGKVVRFIAVGDTGTGKEGQYQVANAIEKVCASRGCDFALGLGDNIYESGVDSVDDEQWLDKFEKPYENLNFPFYMTLGNHDNSYFAGGGLTNKKGEFQVDYHYKEERHSNKWNMPARYYHFSAPLTDEQPLVDFFSLDSNPLASLSDINKDYWQLPYKKKQAQWFDDTIKQTLGKWKIAFAHHPYMSNGSHGNAGLYDYVAGLGGNYKNFLEQEVCNRVDVIIAGHDHDMQWLRPVQSCGKTFHMVSGAGAKSRSFSNPDRNQSYWQADETLGFFYIEIEGDEFRGTAYQLNAEGDYFFAHQQTIIRNAN